MPPFVFVLDGLMTSIMIIILLPLGLVTCLGGIASFWRLRLPDNRRHRTWSVGFGLGAITLAGGLLVVTSGFLVWASLARWLVE